MNIFNIDIVKSSKFKYLYFLFFLILIIILTYISIISLSSYFNQYFTGFKINNKTNSKKNTKSESCPPIKINSSNNSQNSNSVPINNTYKTTPSSNSSLTNLSVENTVEKNIEANPNKNLVNSSNNSKNKNDNKEVFNISENIYTYHEAADLCKVFNAELATYEQLSEEFKKGADWCNYGWTAGQTAYYPTQFKSWEKLQNTSNPNQCGRVGVNGGYFQNPDLTFGVNCYGVRPKSTKCNTDTRNENSLKSPEELRREENIRRLEQNKKNILILPFNNNSWSLSEASSESYINS